MDDPKINVQYLFKLIMKIPVPWVFVLTFLIGVCLQLIIPITLTLNYTTAIKVIGGIIFLFASGIATWSLLIFHKLSTTTTAGETSKKLVTWGPYRFSRNPMYVSLILAYIGEVFLLIQIWPIILLPLVIAYINWIVIPVEETRLNKTFPDEYKNYCNHVRRWI